MKVNKKIIYNLMFIKGALYILTTIRDMDYNSKNWRAWARKEIDIMNELLKRNK